MIRKVLYGCKISATEAENFRCPKKTHSYGYHIDFKLCDRSQDSLGISCLLSLALGTGEPIRARYMCVIGTTSDDCHTWHRHV